MKNELEFREMLKAEGYTQTEIEQEVKEQSEIEEHIAVEEHQAYMKEHTIKCPICGQEASDLHPNGAGILEQSQKFSCNFCDWVESEDK